MHVNRARKRSTIEQARAIVELTLAYCAPRYGYRIVSRGDEMRIRDRAGTEFIVRLEKA